MTTKEKIMQEIDKYTDLQRILAAGDDWQSELNAQMQKIRVKLETLGVPVKELTVSPTKE